MQEGLHGEERLINEELHAHPFRRDRFSNYSSKKLRPILGRGNKCVRYDQVPEDSVGDQSRERNNLDSMHAISVIQMPSKLGLRFLRVCRASSPCCSLAEETCVCTTLAHILMFSSQDFGAGSRGFRKARGQTKQSALTRSKSCLRQHRNHTHHCMTDGAVATFAEECCRSMPPLATRAAHRLVRGPRPLHCSPGFLALQATILTLSAATWLLLSSLKLMSLIRNVQTSSQKR